MRFSERIGKRKTKTEIQLNDMDQDLRNGLWNILMIFIFNQINDKTYIYSTKYNGLFQNIWISFFKEPIDEMPLIIENLKDLFKTQFSKWDYLDIYDIINYIPSIPNLPFSDKTFIDTTNEILKRELSGYRFIDGKLFPITNENEIGEIEKVLNQSRSENLRGVELHLKEAMNKIADKKNPDYRNSIKESISAVESICQKITNNSKGELGKTLNQLKKKLPIHGALEEGFKKIYGYTSDGDGIRHATLEESNLDQEDAIYFLISCSAFINYLIVKANKADITLN